MIERYISVCHLDDPGPEEPAATRDRLREHFPRNATRRMTQLGLLVSHALLQLEPREDDLIVYLSSYGETLALENYLDSFPAASPTLFQTSIHPSAVEQALIGRQQPVGEFLPLTGYEHLLAQGLTAALLAPQRRVLVCGGEERGTWLLKQAAASERTFAFAFALSADPSGACARLTGQAEAGADAVTPYPLPRFIDTLRQRQAFSLNAPSGLRLEWTWS